MSIQNELQSKANKEKALLLSRYFKTGKGEYGEGDVFLGLTVPQQRKIATQYKDAPFKNIEQLLQNNVHEYRLTALLILIKQFEKVNIHDQKRIKDFYLANTKYINNWDLVDLSATRILGFYLMDKRKERKILYTLATSKSLWERRIAVLSTFAFIKQRDFSDSFAISELLLQDKEDLIHKAVGWCLREIGKIDQAKEEVFLQKYYTIMPRTCLRYAIEKFSTAKRLYYLHESLH